MCWEGEDLTMEGHQRIYKTIDVLEERVKKLEEKVKELEKQVENIKMLLLPDKED